MKTPSFPAIPAPPEALAQAATHLHDGRLNQAEAILQALLAAHPADPAVHHLLGRHAAQAGDFTSAIARLTEPCRLAPGSAQMPLELGRVRAAMGAFDAAQRHFEQAIALDTTLFDAWFLLGIIHMRNGHHEQALHPLRQAHRLQPDRADALHALADAQFHAGSPKDALPLWQAIVDAQPGNLDARLRLGETCSRLGLHADAVAGYRRALQVFPDSPDLWMAIAQAEEDDGNKQAAQDAYRHTTTLKPGWALPLSGLLGIQRAKAPPELIAQATTLQQRADLPDPERALLGYALGKTNDGLGQYVAAMASWHDANAARRRMIGPHDRALLERQAQQMMAVFDADFFIRRGIHGNPDPRPVFVVGMPRSGTTLTEQIIAAHTQAFGCGELPDIPLIVKQLGDRWPGSASALDDDVLQQQAQHYLDSASRHAPADALRLVDKAPLNYFNLGLIALLFPQARVVWCRREPRDIALSIYSENFSLDSQFATDLGDIGHFIQVQEQLMRHWQAVLPLPILELQYESLVESPELQAKRLIDFVGLPWQPTCLEFHRSERGVQTPSRWQVREPIHGRSAGRWRNYAADLAAFEAIFTNS